MPSSTLRRRSFVFAIGVHAGSGGGSTCADATDIDSPPINAVAQTIADALRPRTRIRPMNAPSPLPASAAGGPCASRKRALAHARGEAYESGAHDARRADVRRRTNGRNVSGTRKAARLHARRAA